MGAYVLRRLGQAVLTIFGVMILTFLLFRVVDGDIAAGFVGQKGTEQAKADWRHRHGYDRPDLLNVHDRLRLTDLTEGSDPFYIEDAPGSTFTDSLGLIPSDTANDVFLGQYVLGLSRETPVKKLQPPEKKKQLKKKPAAPKPSSKPTTKATTKGASQPATRPATEAASKVASKPAPSTIPAIQATTTAATRPTTTRATKPASKPERRWEAGIKFSLAGGQALTVDLAGVKTCGDVLDRINEAPANKDPKTGKRMVQAGIEQWRWKDMHKSQFLDHLYNSVMFQARSLETNEKLTKIIAQRAPKSLALTVPAMAIGWVAGMVVACFVAYYRGTLIDKLGVFLSVLGMCIPFLAFMIIGQWLMFQIQPVHAYGVERRANIYVPIAIMVVAGLGASVRFYRTVILDETKRDYVRTARAKGASVPNVLFRHVLKNCMLPVLTNLIMAIPFLIMGSLLVETYFGIPGLGDTMLTAINKRDEPIMSAMVFLTAAIYTLALLITDISYAVFDPRVRLR